MIFAAWNGGWTGCLLGLAALLVTLVAARPRECAAQAPQQTLRGVQPVPKTPPGFVAPQGVRTRGLPPAMRPQLPAVDLPTISAEGVEISVDITKLTTTERAGSELSLVNPSSKSKTPTLYQIDRKGAGQWEITAVKGSQKPTIGEMSADDAAISFRWKMGVQKSLASPLRNCVLQVSSGEGKRHIALRTPIKAPAALLDLRREMNVVPVTVEDLPDESALALQFLDLENFKIIGTVGTMDVGFKQAMRVVLQDYTEDSPRVELDLLLLKNGSKLNVNIRPLAVASKTSALPFTLKSVELAATQLTRQIDSSKAKIVFNLDQIPRLEAKIASYDGAVVNAADAVTIQNQLIKWRNEISAMRAENKQFDVVIPQLEKQLAAMPGMKKLSGELHQKVAVRYRVVERVGELEVPLFSAVEGAKAGESGTTTSR